MGELASRIGTIIPNQAYFFPPTYRLPPMSSLLWAFFIFLLPFASYLLPSYLLPRTFNFFPSAFFLVFMNSSLSAYSYELPLFPFRLPPFSFRLFYSLLWAYSFELWAFSYQLSAYLPTQWPNRPYDPTTLLIISISMLAWKKTLRIRLDNCLILLYDGIWFIEDEN